MFGFSVWYKIDTILYKIKRLTFCPRVENNMVFWETKRSVGSLAAVGLVWDVTLLNVLLG